jgi:CNT family concentrative nucleoside transporter
LVVKGIAYLMQRTMKTSGAETLSASANIFVGQTEAPLVVRPFLNRMTQSELMTVMTGGFATVAGGVMAFYVSLLVTQMPNVAGHLLAASIMSAPAALVFGKLFVPETGEPETRDTVHVKVDVETHNLFEAATVGTSMGLSLALNVGAMLIAFIALIGLVDLILAFVGGFLFTTLDPETKLQIVALPEWWNLRGIMGFLFSPLAYLMGITDWGEAKLVGQLLGVKTVANEAVAYTDMGVLLSAEGGPLLSPRAQIVATYALCGFSNFSSIGIQIGALAVMAPDRRTDLSRLALRAMIAGIFACCSTACIAAILL